MYRPKSTLEQWRIFQAVVEHGGYAQAAEKLNKSQSSLNHAVTKLQQTLGIALLEVRGRKAYLTQAGQLFLRRAKLMNHQIQELESLARNIHLGWEAEIRIAVEMAHPRPLLLEALKAYYPQSRGTQLQMFHTVLSGTTEFIEERKADIVITGHVPTGYLSEPLSEVTLWPVCHQSHALAQQSELLSADELSQHLQLVMRDTAQNPKELTGWLRAEQRWTINTFDEAVAILQTGVGFAWLPQSMIEPLVRTGELHHIELRESSQRRFFTYLVLPTPDQLGPSAQCLVNCLRQTHPLCNLPDCEELPPPDLQPL